MEAENVDLKEQCELLKKKIYDRWEKVVLAGSKESDLDSSSISDSSTSSSCSSSSDSDSDDAEISQQSPVKHLRRNSLVLKKDKEDVISKRNTLAVPGMFTEKKDESGSVRKFSRRSYSFSSFDKFQHEISDSVLSGEPTTPSEDRKGSDSLRPSSSQDKRGAFDLDPPLPMFLPRKTSKAAEEYPNLPPKTGTGLPMIPSPFDYLHSDAINPDREQERFATDDIEMLKERMKDCDAFRKSHTSDLLNRVVYDSIIVPDGSTLASIPLGADSDECDIAPYYVREGPDDTTLIFESRIETGNLRRSVQVREFEYDLVCQPDINTNRHTQWFYFRVSNTLEGREYKFNIVNLAKPDSTYNHGMLPVMYSKKDEALSGKGWCRCGHDVVYYQNDIKKGAKGNYFTLTFSVIFDHDQDTVFFAHCYPYSYTDLQIDLHALERDPKRARTFRRRPLCHTLAQNACDLLTITSFDATPHQIQQRMGISLSGRVHPGETNSSWMMRGVIDFLTSDRPEARRLRDHFVFKVVPMLNVDGVINGNYRCSLAGVDLNRQWIEPSRKLHPTVYYLKQMVLRMSEERELLMFCDFHGHSRKKNIFMYGCEHNNDPLLRLSERIFPLILSKGSDKFSFKDCAFRVEKAKEATGRISIWRQAKIVNSFTLESSFGGTDFGELEGFHFNQRDYEDMGFQFCRALLAYLDPAQRAISEAREQLKMMYPARTPRGTGKKDAAKNVPALDAEIVGSDSGDEDSGSAEFEDLGSKSKRPSNRKKKKKQKQNRSRVRPRKPTSAPPPVARRPPVASAPRVSVPSVAKVQARLRSRPSETRNDKPPDTRPERQRKNSVCKENIRSKSETKKSTSKATKARKPDRQRGPTKDRTRPSSSKDTSRRSSSSKGKKIRRNSSTKKLKKSKPEKEGERPGDRDLVDADGIYHGRRLSMEATVRNGKPDDIAPTIHRLVSADSIHVPQTWDEMRGSLRRARQSLDRAKRLSGLTIFPQKSEILPNKSSSLRGASIDEDYPGTSPGDLPPHMLRRYSSTRRVSVESSVRRSLIDSTVQQISTDSISNGPMKPLTRRKSSITSLSLTGGQNPQNLFEPFIASALMPNRKKKDKEKPKDKTTRESPKKSNISRPENKSKQNRTKQSATPHGRSEGRKVRPKKVKKGRVKKKKN
eukprot:303804_1